MAGTRLDPAIAAALDILRDDGLTDIPPVEVVAASRFPTLPIKGLVAFRRTVHVGDDARMDTTIYVLNSSRMYVDATEGKTRAFVLLAATIIHEITHGRGGDETAAISAERDAILHFIRTRPGLSRLDYETLRTTVQELEHRIRKR